MAHVWPSVCGTILDRNTDYLL